MQANELFERYTGNPIIQPSSLSMPCKAVCNPAAHLVNGEILLMLRVIDPQDCSHLTVARSSDGLSNWQIEQTPLLTPDPQGNWYESHGCEDPRLTYLQERDEYVITYIGVSVYGAGVCIATTQDFRKVERLGLVLSPYNKDAALFPRKINGHYWLLHRPSSGGQEDIWLAESDDLVHWGYPYCVLEKMGETGWESGKVGTGPTPIETPEGWLLIYHGAELTTAGWVYQVGLALLDLDNPRKVLARIPSPIFSPTAPYEKGGVKPGVVFPTGILEKEGTLYLYYGADDTGVAVATSTIEILLQALRAA